LNGRFEERYASRRAANALGLAAAAGLLCYALYAQYGLGLEPCPLCILQRIAVLGMGLLFLLALLHDPRRGGARIYGVLLGLLAASGIAVAARHLWIQAQPPGTVAECGASLDYMLDVLPPGEVLMKVLKGSGECSKLDWSFLGLSMPAWVLIACVGLGAWGLWVNLSRRATAP
jgi:disulfide bond formation protein DsbB